MLSFDEYLEARRPYQPSHGIEKAEVSLEWADFPEELRRMIIMDLFSKGHFLKEPPEEVIVTFEYEWEAYQAPTREDPGNPGGISLTEILKVEILPQDLLVELEGLLEKKFLEQMTEKLLEPVRDWPDGYTLP